MLNKLTGTVGWLLLAVHSNPNPIQSPTSIQQILFMCPVHIWFFATSAAYSAFPCKNKHQRP